MLFAASCGAAMQRPPGPPPPPNLSLRLSDFSRKIAIERPVDASAQRSLQYANRYLHTAQGDFHRGHPRSADRLLAAADAFLHVAEHREHLKAGGGPKGPPPPNEIKDHLHRVYFRTEQAQYFLSESHDPGAAALPDLARNFYELAVRAYDRKEWVSADENAKCADEVVTALENLAQAASVSNAPGPAKRALPPPPGPPQ